MQIKKEIRNWKLEIREIYDFSSPVSNFQFPISDLLFT